MIDSYDSFEFDPNLNMLTVRGANAFPNDIFSLADRIEILDVSFGHLSDIPGEIAVLTNLKTAFFSNNAFTSIPQSLAHCPNLTTLGFKSCKIDSFDTDSLPASLEALILTDNQLSAIPTSIHQLRELRKIMATGNRLSSLPAELAHCPKLEMLRMSVNNFTELPPIIYEIPQLAWYSDAANPGSFHPQDNIQLPTIDWDELHVGEKIAENSKNVVYKATLADGSGVAVKLFSSSLTTDGLPVDEINAAKIAGGENRLTGALATITNTPQGELGLVMPIIPSSFKSLGLPPSFATVTRDIMMQNNQRNDHYVMEMLLDIATALAHLHSRGIMHGDLYAHNILSDQTGHSFLADFGAASLYPLAKGQPNIRESIDVQAFGVLIDDSLRSSDLTSNLSRFLAELQNDCRLNVYSQRPAFVDILQRLKTF